MTTATTKNRAVIALTFALGLAIGAGFTAARNPFQVSATAGETLAGFLPDAIVSLTFRTQTGMLTAQRAREGALFAVQATFADRRPMEQCAAPPDLAGTLNTFSELTVKRPLSLREREHLFPLQIGVLDIETIGIAEPAGPILVFTDPNRSSVAVILDGVAAEVTLPATAFARLEQGCAALAAK